MCEQKTIAISVNGTTDQVACIKALAQVMNHFKIQPANDPDELGSMAPRPVGTWRVSEVNGVALWFQMTYFRNPGREE